jgi:hypothetical protein
MGPRLRGDDTGVKRDKNYKGTARAPLPVTRQLSPQYTSPVPGGFSSAAASERYSSLLVPASWAMRLR